MDSFRNFVYVGNYVHLKSFAWKRDCPISSKLQTSWIWPRTFNKTLLFKGSWILTYFWYSRWNYFGYISGKVAKPHFLESPQVSQSTSTFILTGLPITNFKNMKNLCFLAAPFSNEKIANIWNFQWIKYLGKGLSYLKKWSMEGSAIVQITGRRSCYFISLNIV